MYICIYKYVQSMYICICRCIYILYIYEYACVCVVRFANGHWDATNGFQSTFTDIDASVWCVARAGPDSSGSSNY